MNGRLKKNGFTGIKFHPEINGVFVLSFSDMIQGDAGMATCGPSIKANTGESS